MSKHDNIYNILGKLASLEPQAPKQENILKQLNESAVVAINPLSLKDRLAQKLAETKTVDEELLMPKEKKFAALAEPKDKITYADKIAGAKKKVDEISDQTAYNVGHARAQNFLQSHEENPDSQATRVAGKKLSKNIDKQMSRADRLGKPDPFQPKIQGVEKGYAAGGMEVLKKPAMAEGEYQDGPNKSDVPAFQRKAKAAPGDDSWKTSQQDLDDEASKSPTGAAGLAKAKARLGMNEQDAELYDENNAHSSLPGTRRVSDKEHSEYDAAAHTVRKWMRKRGWDPKSEFKPAMKYIIDNLEATHDDTLTDDVKMAACTCRKHHDGVVVDEGVAKQAFVILDTSLIDQISPMDGTEVDPDNDVVWSTNPNVTAKLMAFARKNPQRLKVSSSMSGDNTGARPAGNQWSQDSSPDLQEGWDDMMKSVKDRSEAEKKDQGTGRFDKQTTSTGTRYTRKPETFDSGDTDGEEKTASDGPKKKGRPAKAKAPERTTAKAYKHKGTRVSEAINLETYVDDTMAEIAALFIVEKAKGKKPDFLDMDKDGDKKESMKKAVSDKKKNPFGNKKDVKESKQQLTENTLQAIVRRFGKEVREFAEGGEFDQDLFEALYDYYFDDMPYGVKKGRARDGDPYEWVADHFHDAIQSGDVEINETKVGHKDLDELAALAGIGGRQQMESSCNMTAEGQMCPEHGMVECGGMMYEGEEKPDFLDVDSDDDKEESFKKAVDDKKEGNDTEDLEEQCGMPPMGGMMGSEEAESGMSINTSMDTKTGRKTVTVTADGEAAEELASMLRMAGMGGAQSQPQQKHIDVVIGRPGGQEVDEEYANEPNVQNGSTRAIMQQGDDLNKPKSMYKHNYRGGDNPMSMKEDKLFKLYDAMKSR